MHRSSRQLRGPASMAALLSAAAILLTPAGASALTDYTWTGGGSQGTPEWSEAANWTPGAPSGSVGTLTFPALTSGACTAEPPTATCYQGHDDVSGLSVSGISIDDGQRYFLDGNSLTLGSGGLDAAPSVSDTGSGSPQFFVPITLGTSQTWSITGGAKNQQLAVAEVDGAADNLAIDFVSEPFFSIEDHAEVGTVTATGQGGTLVLDSASLNGTSGNPVGLSAGAGLFASRGSNAVGPLTMSEDSLQVGNGSALGAGTLAADGSVTLGSTSHAFISVNHSGTAAGTDYSQVSATGNVNLGSASLAVLAPCQTGTALTPGDVDTLISTTGSLSGAFSGVPDGTTVQATCQGGPKTPPSVKINYTAHTVTATVVTGGSGGTTVPTTTAVHTSNANPAVGEAVTYTARVTPEVFAGAEPSGSVEFLDGGSPIGGCSAQPLTPGPPFSTATCTTTYPAASTHTISATYLGDTLYGGSTTGVTLTVTVHGGSEGGGGAPAGGGGPVTAAPLTATPISAPVKHKKRPLKCKKGFKKTMVHGKAKCVKAKGKHAHK